MYYGYYGYYYDPTYILVIIGIMITLWASFNVKGTFNKYSRYRSNTGLTGAEIARKLLDVNGLYDVSIEHVEGSLTDFYDPSRRILCLSDTVYGSTSVAAIGVAAHECGHAIQHALNYVPMRVRSSIVPAVNFASNISWPLIFIGFILNKNEGYYLIMVGIFLFCAVVLFHLVTLPVEIDASRRAVKTLRENGFIDQSEGHMVKKVLTAAAFTYISSALMSVLQLIRLILIARGRRDD